MRELFVYYRVRADRLDAARSAALAFGAALARGLPQLRTRWLRRADEATEPAGAQTWMEHHAIADAHDPAGVTLRIQASIEAFAQGLLPYIDGPRRVESFAPLPWAEPPTD